MLLPFLCCLWYPEIPNKTTMPQPPPKTLGFYFAQDSHYHLMKNYSDFLDGESLFYGSIVEVTTNKSCNATLVYQPNDPLFCPKQYGICPYNESADMWICYPTDTTNTCIPIGFHQYDIEIRHNPLRDSLFVFCPGHYKLKGYSDITTNVEIVCSSNNIFEFVSQFQYNKDTHEYSFRLIAPTACAEFGSDPTFPVYTGNTPLPIPFKDIDPESFIFDEHSENEIINFSMKDFQDVETSMILTLIGTFHSIDLYLSFNRMIPCPSQYKCKTPNGVVFSEASIWKCWKGFLGNNGCYPIADLRYGFDIRSTRIMIEGGYAGLKTIVYLKCNPSIPKSSLKFEKSNTEMDGKSVSLSAETSAVCERQIVINNEKKSTFGGVFVIAFWSILSLSLFIGVVIPYLMKDTLSFLITGLFKHVSSGWRIVTLFSTKNYRQ